MGLLDKIFGRAKSGQVTTTDLTLEEAKKIIQDYGPALESSTHAPGCIVDACYLPHPKERIKQAFIVALRSTTDPQKREQCKVGLLYLADWQEGVGDMPVGLDLRKMDLNADARELADQVISQRAGMEKWDGIMKAEREAMELDLRRLGLW
jgi:hypothetical protein